MGWPFSRKKRVEPPPASPSPPDYRIWNEDWQVGDTAECVRDNWHKTMLPWNRPKIGQRFIVTGFEEGLAIGDGSLRYFLKLKDWPVSISTTTFRKVRPEASEKSEIVERILNAPPGKDRTREEA